LKKERGIPPERKGKTPGQLGGKPHQAKKKKPFVISRNQRAAQRQGKEVKDKIIPIGDKAKKKKANKKK